MPAVTCPVYGARGYTRTADAAGWKTPSRLVGENLAKGIESDKERTDNAETQLTAGLVQSRVEEVAERRQ